MKKILLPIAMLAMACTVAAGIASVPAETVKAAGDVEINEKNFPDEKFRDYVKENFDTDWDGFLSDYEISESTKIDVGEKGISDLKGIEYFTYLTELRCNQNKLTSLDISNNEALQSLYCAKNDITKLDISACPKLVMAYKEGYDDSEGNESVVSQIYNGYEGDTKVEYWLCFDSKVELRCETIDVTAASKTVVCGKTTTCKVDLNNLDSNTPVTWLSSDDNIATVDETGKVKAKMAGLVTIIAKTPDNIKGKVIITVLYKDVSNTKDFWYEPTNTMTGKGVVKGYDKQTLFKPANKCTRAQMVTFMWRLMGEPEPDSETCKFKDVKKTDYFYKACIWGNENHIVEGYKNGTFGPQIICTRKHAVTFLWRLGGCCTTNEECKFSDVKESDYYYDAVRWATAHGILEGYSDGTFRPNGDCLRRQMVTFLDRYYKKVMLPDLVG